MKLKVLWNHLRPAERREGQLRAGRVPVPRLRRRLPVLLALQAVRGAARGQLRRGELLRRRGHLRGARADGGLPRQRRRPGVGPHQAGTAQCYSFNDVQITLVPG